MLSGPSLVSSRFVAPRAAPEIDSAWRTMAFEARDALEFLKMLYPAARFAHEFGTLLLFVGQTVFSMPCETPSAAAHVSAAESALQAIGWAKIESILLRRCRHTLAVVRGTTTQYASASERALRRVPADIVSVGGCTVDDLKLALALVYNVAADNVSVRSAPHNGMHGAQVWIGRQLIWSEEVRFEHAHKAKYAALLLALDRLLDDTESAVDAAR